MGTAWSWSDFQRVVGDVAEGGGQVRCGGRGYGGEAKQYTWENKAKYKKTMEKEEQKEEEKRSHYQTFLAVKNEVERNVFTWKWGKKCTATIKKETVKGN